MDDLERLEAELGYSIDNVESAATEVDTRHKHVDALVAAKYVPTSRSVNMRRSRNPIYVDLDTSESDLEESDDLIGRRGQEEQEDDRLPGKKEREESQNSQHPANSVFESALTERSRDRDAAERSSSQKRGRNNTVTGSGRAVRIRNN